VPSREDYKKHLEDEMEVENVEFEDMTKIWTSWTTARMERFLANKEKHIAMHGEGNLN
jgi:hypothetical protein